MDGELLTKSIDIYLNDLENKNWSNLTKGEIELISDLEYKEGKVIFNIRTLVSKGTYIRALLMILLNFLELLELWVN